MTATTTATPAGGAVGPAGVEPAAQRAASGRGRRFAGQVAIVTGVGSEIGSAIARRLAEEGAALALGDLEEDALAAAARELEPLGGRVVTSAGDLSVEAAAKALVGAAMTAFGRVDILVNNAGGGVILPFLSHTPDTLRATLDRNLWTVLWCTRAALPAMVERGYGRIVHIGADSVRNGLANHAAYNAAKGGVHGLTTGLAREFARNGITVNTVAPCAVDSEPLRRFVRDRPEVAQRFLDVIPMGRAAALDEVASAVAYLASPEAAFITGQVLSVNGGSTML